MGRPPRPGRVRFTGYAHADTLAALRELAAEAGWTLADTLDVALAAGVEQVRRGLGVKTVVSDPSVPSSGQSADRG